MKTLIATLLATAASSTFAFAPTAALNHDPATYRNATQKANADYKAASARCAPLSGNAEDVCKAEAKAARARTEADAIARYNNTDKGRTASRSKVADADYAVAKARCGAMSGAEKDSCMVNAKAVHTAALAEVKAGRDSRVSAGVDGKGMIANTNTTEPAKADAVDQCAQIGATSKTGCLIDNRAPVTAATGATTASAAEMANRTENAAGRALDKTKAVASNVAEKTREVARTAVEKTKQLASNVGDKTENAAERSENAMDRAGDRTRDTAAVAADKTERATERAGDMAEAAASKTAVAASDTAITTKVKAGIFAEPELKSMAIHVETEQGVVMLSGFVESKAEAAKAVKVAKGVEGVTSVRSAIKVK